MVFVKVAQTLATREDLVGAEAAAALGVLQVMMLVLLREAAGGGGS